MGVSNTTIHTIQLLEPHKKLVLFCTILNISQKLREVQSIKNLFHNSE